MKLKKESIALALVIIALVAYISLRNTDNTQYDLPKLPAVETGSITKIDIQGAEVSLTIEKQDGIWKIQPKGYPADMSQITDMLKVIGPLTLTAMVSESENYFRYDLTDDKKLVVKAWAGNSLQREFEVGKSAPTYNHTFVKLPDDPRVYHARGSFRFTFQETVDGLRDKQVLAFEPKDIREMHVSGKDLAAVFTRSEKPAAEQEKADATGDGAEASSKEKTIPVWKNSQGETLDAAKANRLLSSLGDLKCSGYIYEQKDEKAGKEQPPLFSIRLVGSKEHVLNIYEKPDKDAYDYPASSTDVEDSFKLSTYDAENIMNVFQKEEPKEDEAPAEGENASAQ